MEIVVDVEGVEGSIGRTVARPATQPLLDLVHERQEVGGVAMVKGLGQLSQDKLADVGHFRGHHPRGIAPIVFADAGFLVGGLPFSGRRLLVAAPFAAELAVRIAGWLGCFVEAPFLYEGLGIVLANPGQDMFGVDGYRLAESGTELLL